MKTFNKIALAVILIVCILKMPYWYYQLVRFVAFWSFVYFPFREERKDVIIACAISAVLFNPLVPIHLNRVAWNVIDVSYAFVLITWVVVEVLPKWANRKSF
jgi:hypothetical protein